MTLFKTIVADPPWPYKTPGKIGASLEHRPNRDLTAHAGSAGSAARYGAMSIPDLCALKPPADDPAHLYLWFTNTFGAEAHQVAKAWGFRPMTILTYVKVKPDGSPSMKMGRYYRGATEHVLFAIKGSMRLQAKRALPTAYLWPRLPHSVKPEAFYDLVEEASPGPYLEMFARRHRLGWEAWGNQVNSTVSIEAA